jgi:G3E family GTPase
MTENYWASLFFEIRGLTVGCISGPLIAELLSALAEIKQDLDQACLLIETTGLAHQNLTDMASGLAR